MNESILNLKWISTGEIVSNDGEIATVDIPESDGSVLLLTEFVIRRADTDCERARFLDEFHIGAQVEILNEAGRQSTYKLLHAKQGAPPRVAQSS